MENEDNSNTTTPPDLTEQDFANKAALRICDEMLWDQNDSEKVARIIAEVLTTRTKCPRCGCEYVQVGKVFTVNLNCNCDCHKHSATDFTEQARQLVEEWDADRLEWEDEEQRLIERIASFAAEAATQGRIEGVAAAVSLCNDYARLEQRLEASIQDADREQWARLRHVKYGAAEIAIKIRALSPDPNYIDQVRGEARRQAAIEAFTDAVSVVTQSLNSDDAIAKLKELIAAIENNDAN